MAAESWDSSSAVTGQTSGNDEAPEFRNLRKMLEEEPFRVHFFQAVRMLQKMEHDRKPVGYFITPQGETIRFSSRTSLAFPPSELYDLRRMENGQMSMTVEFMGLCAAISVMPATYTEFLIERTRQKDHAMEDFLNIFNHRMISFFYRGWEKYRFFIEYEKTGEDQAFRAFARSAGSWNGELAQSRRNSGRRVSELRGSIGATCAYSSVIAADSRRLL